MTPVYAIALGVGFALLIGWVAAASVAATVPGWERLDPQVKFGSRGRGVVACLVGAGMAGMSATFAGWPGAAALAAAVGGGMGLLWLAVVVERDD